MDEVIYRAKRILTMCQGGNVRSTTLAYVFKYKYGLDAIACGWEQNSELTKEMLCDWADEIIALEQYILNEKIPQKYHYKAKVYDVGPDRWGMALHPELIVICDRLITEELGRNTNVRWDQVSAELSADQKRALERIEKQDISSLVDPLWRGVTIKSLWQSLSLEQKYAFKLLLYQEKITDHLDEFIQLDERSDAG